jgi:hypothetical protein
MKKSVKPTVQGTGISAQVLYILNSGPCTRNSISKSLNVSAARVSSALSYLAKTSRVHSFEEDDKTKWAIGEVKRGRGRPRKTPEVEPQPKNVVVMVKGMKFSFPLEVAKVIAQACANT